MKESKKILTNYVEKISRNFFGNGILSIVLFLRCFNKFKRSINRPISSIKFSEKLDKINDYEYKITSQNNEDGIIEYIFKKIPNEKIFIEIGIGYYEFNSLNLIKNNWAGTLIEQNTDECLVVKKLLNFFFPENKVEIINKSINKKNINEIINLNKIDFFSIDIDSNDYWILKDANLDNISCVCLEYNHWIGKSKKKTIPYDEKFNYIDNGFFGASLLAFDELMNSKNFRLIAIESSGTNAFYVQDKYSKSFEVLDPIKSFKSTGRLYSKEKKEEILSKVNEYNFLDI